MKNKVLLYFILGLLSGFIFTLIVWYSLPNDSSRTIECIDMITKKVVDCPVPKYVINFNDTTINLSVNNL